MGAPIIVQSGCQWPSAQDSPQGLRWIVAIIQAFFVAGFGLAEDFAGTPFDNITPQHTGGLDPVADIARLDGVRDAALIGANVGLRPRQYSHVGAFLLGRHEQQSDVVGRVERVDLALRINTALDDVNPV